MRKFGIHIEKELKLIIFPILIFFSFLAAAQENHKYYTPKFQKLGLRDGLSNLNVRSIVQDDLGYIWMATARGLNRYDGISFKHYLFNDDENSLYNDMITSLYKNSEGVIFCATTSGLNVFDTKKDRMLRLSINNGSFFNFIEVNNTTYGISYLSGLCAFNKANNLFERLPNSANDRLINYPISDEETGIWAVSVDKVLSYLNYASKPGKDTLGQVLVNYNPYTDTFNKFDIPVSNGEYSNGPIVKVDSLIILSGNNFNTFNLNRLKFTPFPQKWSNLTQIKNTEILTIKRIDENSLWIGTRTEGLYVFNLETNTLINLNKANSDINSNFIYCIFKDRDENIWLGSFDHGVNIVFKDRGNVNYDNSLNKLTDDKFINSITSDIQNNYYIGTRNDGFYIYNAETETSKHFNVGNSFLTSNHIRTIFVDSQHKIWVADQKALHITDLKTENVKEYFIPGSNEGMEAFCELEEKVIACSDAQGFFIFDIDGNLIKQERRLGANISQVIPLNNNELIVASYTNGIFIYKLNSGVYRNIYNPNKSKEKTVNQVITIYLDSDSVLWIGNYMDGLHKLDLKTDSVTIYTMEDGLSNNDIVGIVEDKSGVLWLSTSYGISRFDKKQEFINYFYNEGLENLQFHAKSAHIDKDGVVYFSGCNGLTYFNPEVLSQSISKNAPKIILESLTVQNRKITVGDETDILSEILNNTRVIKLNHKQNSITIDYHAFDFIAADEIRYSYILEGLEEEWNNAGKRNTANFSNLQPGRYTFKVKAQNNKGIWSDVSSLIVKIKPSPFLTIWAFAIYSLLLSAIIYITFQLRLRAKLYKNRLEFEHKERVRENEIAQMKMRFFANISHEIRTPLTLIKGNVDLLSKDLAEKKIKIGYFNALQYSTNRLISLVNQLLSVRKLENDTLDLYIKKEDIVQITKDIINPFTYVASSRDIVIEVDSYLDKLILPIDRDKYEKIMSNLLSNSLKHVKAKGQIKVKIEKPKVSELVKLFGIKLKNRAASFVRISVIDNGIGIPKKDLPHIFDRFKQSKTDRNNPDYSGTGIGLNFTKRLVELHRGAITVSSKPDVETVFSFVLSLDDKTYEKNVWIKAESAKKSELQIKHTEKTSQLNTNKEKALILLVEDDLELNRFITSSLKKQFNIISSYNGKEGITMAQNKLPELIISDIMMPEMDGFELCKHIREDDLISHIPIILLTAKTDMESQISGYEYGADDYISKPFELSVLIARINNLIESRKKLQAFYKQGILLEHKVDISNQFELNFIKKIEAIIAAEYQSQELNVNFLANRMNMSRTNFYRKFMSVMDISPKDFITKYRIKKSIELMNDGNGNFGEISHLCGFGSQSSFSSIFKKEKGVTPKQYKKSL